MLQKKITKLQEQLRNYSGYCNNMQNSFKRINNEMKIEITQKDFEINNLKQELKNRDQEISDLKKSLTVLCGKNIFEDIEEPKK